MEEQELQEMREDLLDDLENQRLDNIEHTLTKYGVGGVTYTAGDYDTIATIEVPGLGEIYYWVPGWDDGGEATYMVISPKGHESVTNPSEIADELVDIIEEAGK